MAVVRRVEPDGVPPVALLCPDCDVQAQADSSKELGSAVSEQSNVLHNANGKLLQLYDKGQGLEKGAPGPCCRLSTTFARAGANEKSGARGTALPIGRRRRTAQTVQIFSTFKMIFLSADTEELKNMILALHSSACRCPPRHTCSRGPQHTHTPPCHPGRAAAQPTRPPRHHQPTTRPIPDPGPGPGPGPGPPRRRSRAAGVLESCWARAESTPTTRRDSAKIAPRSCRDCAES